MQAKWLEMRVGVREEMREDIARRVALFIQQTESEMGRVKTAIREIQSEITPLQNEMERTHMEMDRFAQASRTALQAAEAASGLAKGNEAKAQGLHGPWTTPTPCTPPNYRPAYNNNNKIYSTCMEKYRQ